MFRLQLLDIYSFLSLKKTRLSLAFGYHMLLDICLLRYTCRRPSVVKSPRFIDLNIFSIGYIRPYLLWCIFIPRFKYVAHYSISYPNFFSCYSSPFRSCSRLVLFITSSLLLINNYCIPKFSFWSSIFILEFHCQMITARYSVLSFPFLPKGLLVAFWPLCSFDIFPLS